jgi:hypothetical protein
MFAAAGVANAAAVDFEDILGTNFNTPITSGGFDWAFESSGWFIGDPDNAFYPDGVVNGSNILVASGDRSGPASVVMTKTGGGTFDIFSLFAASSNALIANTIDIIGTLSGGGSVSATIDVGGTFAASILSGFTDLTSVTFTSGQSGSYNTAGFALDDIETAGVVPAIPVPAALPLMVLALGALGVAGRRRRA